MTDLTMLLVLLVVYCTDTRLEGSIAERELVVAVRTSHGIGLVVGDSAHTGTRQVIVVGGR